jgi:hypothetical protein
MQHKAGTRQVEGAHGERFELDTTSTEPVLVPALTAAVTQVVAVAVAFGLDLDTAQQVAIIGLPAALMPIAVWWSARKKAWAGKTVAGVVEHVEEAATRP